MDNIESLISAKWKKNRFSYSNTNQTNPYTYQHLSKIH